jgi:hypothetical protein
VNGQRCTTGDAQERTEVPLVTGRAGSLPGRAQGCLLPACRLYAGSQENTQLYQIIRIDGDELHYEARTATGLPYDGFTLRKRPGDVNALIERVPEVPERREGSGE